MLDLMYITNNPQIATIAENAGVDRIFVDMEYIGKEERQHGLSTVKSKHTIDDVHRIKATVKHANVVVRVNPIHEATNSYISSEEEIQSVIDAGADLVMLPYFQSIEEVQQFIQIVAGKSKVFLLLESKKAYDVVDEILSLDGIDEIHIGINDLSLDLHKKFMFELLSDGIVENLCNKFKNKGIKYGFGGIARLGQGDLPAEYIISEHYRLGSTCAILSRSFCNIQNMINLDEIRDLFNKEVKQIRSFENICAEHYAKLNCEYDVHRQFFIDNINILKNRVKEIVERY